ncbi:MAG: hypothetical protein KTR31_38655 [Myxococcales bacterium]|nr:hypothetical protein [Myxococcales bacterium]
MPLDFTRTGTLAVLLALACDGGAEVVDASLDEGVQVGSEGTTAIDCRVPIDDWTVPPRKGVPAVADLLEQMATGLSGTATIEGDDVALSLELDMDDASVVFSNCEAGGIYIIETTAHVEIDGARHTDDGAMLRGDDPGSMTLSALVAPSVLPAPLEDGRPTLSGVFTSPTHAEGELHWCCNLGRPIEVVGTWSAREVDSTQ